jgi:hypothetical protein
MTLAPRPRLTDTSFDPDTLAAEARDLAGAPAGQPLRFLPALRCLTASLDTEAKLTRAGRQRVRAALMSQLVTQLRENRLRHANPAIDTLTVPRPTFITGLLRTGTTLLQNLLADHPDVHAPRLWELLAPATEIRDGWRRRARLVRAARRYVTEYYTAAPAFRAIHPLDARRPEECHRLTGVTFQADIYSLRYRVPAYIAWLGRQDLREAYAYHLTLLRCVLWRRPAREFVVLKCPSHLWHLDDLAAVYPNANVVRLHRDPEICVPSVCSLTAVVRAARSSDVDKREIGAYWLDHVGRALSDLRPGAGQGSLRVLDLRYQDMVADPIDVAGRVCEFAGIPRTSRAEQRMRRFLTRNPQGKHGAHHYTTAEFGLSSGELGRRFAAYRDNFNL